MVLALAAACGGGGGGGKDEPAQDGRGTIGPEGGTIRLAGGPTLVVPAGALAAATALEIREAAGAVAPAGAIGKLWEFLPEGTTFAVPATVRLPIPDGTTSGTASAYWSAPAGGWVSLEAAFAGTTASVGVEHFSRGFVGAACVEGATCPGEDTCHLGTLSCGTGGPVCGASAPVEDGTSCGGESVCVAGACGAAPAGVRTVHGTYLTVWWHDDGTKETVTSPPTPATTLVGALTWSGSAWIDHPGEVNASTGELTVPGVPYGRYLLYVDRRPAGGSFSAVEHFASALDLGRQRSGRPDATPITSAPQVTWNVSGLVPWTAFAYPSLGDSLEVSGGRAWEPLAGRWWAGELEAGVRSASVARAWGATARSPYPDSSKGDVLELHQLATVRIPEGEPGAGVSYRRVAASAQLSNLALHDGTAATVTATLLPPARTGSLTAEFATEQAEALAADLGYPAENNGYTLNVITQAHRTRYPAPADPGGYLLELDASPDVPEFSRTLTYGRPLDSTRHEVVCAGVEGSVPYQAEAATGHSSIGMIAESCWPAGEAPQRLAPALGGVGVMALEGTGFAERRAGVSTTPTVGWSAPGAGTAEEYVLFVMKLSVRPDGYTTGKTVGTFNLIPSPDGAVTFTFPPGILEPGGEYMLEVFAYAGEGTQPDHAPAYGYPLHTSITGSPPFTCAAAP